MEEPTLLALRPSGGGRSEMNIIMYDECTAEYTPDQGGMF